MSNDTGQPRRSEGPGGGQYTAHQHDEPGRRLSESEGWPALAYEELEWKADVDLISRSQARKHAGPYSAAITPEIAHLTPSVSSAVIAESEEAARAVVRFDEHVSGVFGGEFAPMSAILLRTESASSSQIENLTVGARQIAMAELGEHSSNNAKIVAGNVRAMEAAIELSANIDEDSILAMHEALLGGSQPEHAGKWRTEQVWIGGSGSGPRHAQFIPPHHDRVEPAVADLLRFVARDDVPTIVQAAIAHAQFETIHPFVDGNGRTGRALVHALLTNKGLTQQVTVPVSSGLLVNTGGYFDALGEYRKGDIVPIVQQFNEAAIFAVGNGRRLVSDLEETITDVRSKITARSDAAAWKIADLLVGQPVINNAYVCDKLGISDMAAQRGIEHLESIGVLEQPKKQARNRVWQVPAVLADLDAFASRIRRVR